MVAVDLHPPQQLEGVFLHRIQLEGPFCPDRQDGGSRGEEERCHVFDLALASLLLVSWIPDSQDTLLAPRCTALAVVGKCQCDDAAFGETDFGLLFPLDRPAFGPDAGHASNMMSSARRRIGN